MYNSNTWLLAIHNKCPTLIYMNISFLLKLMITDKGVTKIVLGDWTVFIYPFLLVVCLFAEMVVFLAGS